MIWASNILDNGKQKIGASIIWERVGRGTSQQTGTDLNLHDLKQWTANDLGSTCPNTGREFGSICTMLDYEQQLI